MNKTIIKLSVNAGQKMVGAQVEALTNYILIRVGKHKIIVEHILSGMT